MTTQIVLTADPIVEAVKDSRVVIVDTETSSLFPWRDGQIMAGVGVKPYGKDGFYLPVRHGMAEEHRLEQLEKFTNKLTVLDARVKRRDEKGIPQNPKDYTDRDFFEYVIDSLQPAVNASLNELTKLSQALAGKIIVFHNAKFDLSVLWQDGVCLVEENVMDTVVTWRLVYEDEISYELKELAERHIPNSHAREIEQRLKRYKSKLRLKTYNEIPASVIAPEYVDGDLRFCEALAKESMRLINLRGLQPLLEQEKQTTKELFYLEQRGMKIDVKFVREKYEENKTKGAELSQVCLAQVKEGLRQRRAELKGTWVNVETAKVALVAALFKENGGTFNVNSSQKEIPIVFHGLGIHSPVETKNKNESWDKNALTVIASEHEDEWARQLTQNLIAARSALHIASYYENYLELMDADGIIHCSIHQAGAKTGRCSCKTPNLQNVPKKESLSGLQSALAVAKGRQENVTVIEDFGGDVDDPDSVADESMLDVRMAFIPRDGHFLLMSDWSQIELRILADNAQEPEWLLAFELGLDVHELAALAAYGPKPAGPDLAKWWRKLGKQINFGIVYGVGDFTLSVTIQRTPEETGDFKDAYFARFPRLKRHIDKVTRECEDKGFVSNMWGRRRYLTMSTSYKAVNFQVQGSSADFMKDTFCRFRPLRLQDLAYCLNIVHDEYINEITYANAEAAIPLIALTMNTSDRIRAPLKADLSWSPTSWGEAESLDCVPCEGRGRIYPLTKAEMFDLFQHRQIKRLEELRDDYTTCENCNGRGYDLTPIIRYRERFINAEGKSL